MTVQPIAGANPCTAQLSFTSFGTVRNAPVVQRRQKRSWNEWKDDETVGRDPDTEQTGPNGSPAGDGIPNLLKYATGLDPLKPCGNVVQVSAEETDGNFRLVLNWPANPEATGIKHAVEASGDLRIWAEIEEMETEGNKSAIFRDAVPVNGEKPPAAFPAPENFSGGGTTALTVNGTSGTARVEAFHAKIAADSGACSEP